MIQRRELIQRGLMVFGSSLPLASTGQSLSSKFKGTVLRMNYPAHPHYDRVERQFARFTAETGIRIEGQRVPYLEMKAGQLASFAKSEGDFDLAAYLILWKVEYAQKKYLLPLGRFLGHPEYAQRFQFDDLIGPYVDALGRVGAGRSGPPAGAEVYGLPCGAETSVLVARTDLLRKHGLSMPTTYTDLLSACRVIQDKERMASIATRGLPGHHITHAWLLHLSPHGGAVLDANDGPALNRPQAVRATEVFRELASMAQPSASTAGFAEMQDAFLKGSAAFYLDSSNILGVAQDPKKTTLARNFGYAMHPSGTRLSGQTGGFGVGIASNTRYPEAAFHFLQWLLSPRTDLAIARDGGVPARWSTLADRDFKADFPEQSIMRFALRAANPAWRPLIPEWEGISQSLLGQALPGMVFGNEPIAARLSQLSAAIGAELARSGAGGPKKG